MKKLLSLLFSTIGGSIGWWAGDYIGMVTAFILSMIGTGIGMYYGVRLAREYWD